MIRWIETACIFFIAAVSFAGGLWVSGAVGTGVYGLMMLAGFMAFAVSFWLTDREHCRHMREIDAAHQGVLAAIRANDARRVAQIHRMERASAAARELLGQDDRGMLQ
jgi:hypothetical protein